MNQSPYSSGGTTPNDEYYYARVEPRFSTATPSPHRYSYYAHTPQRPQTRATHHRNVSSGFNEYGSPRPSVTPSPRFTSDGRYATANGGVNDYYFDQQPQTPRMPARPQANTHARRNSTSVPQRPSTARPASSHHTSSRKTSAQQQQQPQSAPSRKATEADAEVYKIPPGYSLKNWDPTEEPILLLGSVFDANSLGKWIYDWTVYHHGPATPISDMAGELWLLLIQLAGKIKRSEETVERVRSKDAKDIVEDFIEAGERLTDKLRKLLKSCEAPMLKAASKRKDSQLGKNAGVEFVDTLFGRERELERTEKFMQSVRLFNLRFDANCEEVLKNPTR